MLWQNAHSLSSCRCASLKAPVLQFEILVKFFSFALLGFTAFKRHSECLAALRQHQIDRIQEAVPSVPVGKGEPLQHHERVQVLGEKRIAHILRQPLMETAHPVSVSILRAFAFELFQSPGPSRS